MCDLGDRLLTDFAVCSGFHWLAVLFLADTVSFAGDKADPAGIDRLDVSRFWQNSIRLVQRHGGIARSGVLGSGHCSDVNV